MPFKRPAKTPAKGRPTKRLKNVQNSPPSPTAAPKKGRGGGGRGRGRKLNISADDEPVNNARHQLLAEEIEEENDVEFHEEGGRYIDDIWIPPQTEVVEAPFKGERLIIEKIVCENFKSYAGIKTIGQFHKSFTAIIGPNGNGKSNVIDAMLFVFGYKASKLRSKKLSVLIHESDKIKDLPSASVTVHFVRIYDDGREHKDDKPPRFVPNSKITVKRKVSRDNSTVYYLNNSKVKFQDVADFLKQNGIDIVHNRFLILQGEVETISQMPPKSLNGQEPGLLEFLEEIIGTRRYIRTLVKLENRIEELDTEREGQLRRVDMVEKDKNAIEEPVRKAKDYLRKQNSKIRYEHQYCQVKLRDSSKKFADKQVRITELEVELTETNKKIAEIESLNDSRKTEFETADEKWKILEKEFTTKNETMKKSRENFEKYKSNLKHSNEQRKKTAEDITNIEKELENMVDLPMRNEQDIQKLNKREEELKDLISQEEERIKEPLEELRVKADKIKTELEEAKNALSSMKTKYAEINKRHDAAEKDLKSYQDASEKENIELEKRLKDLEDTKKELAEKERKGRNSIDGKEGPLKEAIKNKQNEKVEVNQKLNVINTELGTAQSKYLEARESVEGLKSNDSVYKLFLGENKVRGVYGRFKDLAKIDEKYNVAATVSTSFLEFWVVDNDSTASICINLLKQHKLPFQNFICLNKCHERYMNDPFNCPADSQRIFDLMDISKPELRPVFYKAFHNTLVCDDIDIANKVAFYGSSRHKVATLKGEIISPSGSMTGGGTGAITGKFNTGMSKQLGQKDRFSKEDVARLKAQVEAKQKEYDELSSKLSILNEEEYQLTNQLKKLIADAQSFQNDVKSLKAQVPLKEKRYEEQKKIAQGVQIDAKVLKQKEKVFDCIKKEKEEFEGPYEEKIDKVKEITDKLKEYQETKKKKLEELVNKNKATLKKVEEEKRKKVLEIKNIEGNRNKLNVKKERYAEDILRIQTEMVNLSKLKDELKASCEELGKSIADLSDKKMVAKEERDRLKLAYEESGPEKKILLKNRAILELDFNKLTGEMDSYKHKVKDYSERLQNFKLKDLFDEEVEPLKELTEEEISNCQIKDLEHQIQRYERKLQMEVPNLGILEEYRTKLNIYLKRVEELDNLTEKIDKFKEAYQTTSSQRISEFMDGYLKISKKLKELFRMISLGGDAELELVDSTDPFSSGVEFSVRPLKKTWKKISNLSGGEKTLSSLALVFALHYFKPSPFYVMDEIDAALDFRNVGIIANYIKERTCFTQFIIISLRSNMFELANCLMGIYKLDGVSNCVPLYLSSLYERIRANFEINDFRKMKGGVKSSQFQSQPAQSQQKRKEKEKLQQQQLQQLVEVPAESEPITAEQAEPISQAQVEVQTQNSAPSTQVLVPIQ